jgi:hypothetical protein
MGALFGYARVDSLDMSGLPRSRFESRAVCVAVCGLERGARVPHPIPVGSRRRGLSVRPWMGASFGYASVDSLDMSWLPLSRFDLPYLRTIKGHLRTYGRPTDKRPRTAPNRVHHRVPHSI